MNHTLAPPLKPQLTLPVDEGLHGLHLLFDNNWVWQTFCTHFGVPTDAPQWIRPRQISYQPGARAIVSYVAERQWERWVIEDEFAIELVDGKPERVFRYPNDPYLPGLRWVASAPDAHKLLTKYVPITPHRVRVEAVRYRPATRAVMRHIVSWRAARLGKMTLFVRVMPPTRVSRLLLAAELARHSGFALPKLVGCWNKGGVIWLSKIEGSTVRSRIRKGTPPNPELILSGLAKLWSAPVEPNKGHPLNLQGGFHLTQRLLSHLLQGEEERQMLHQVTEVLGPFSETWRPSTLAHNDFYDDQVFFTPDGHLVLVDFEEVGPGDPLFDVGNALAHLLWMSRFGIAREPCDLYRRRLRSVALQRFGWKEQDLNLREALAIFRLSANPFRQLQHNWLSAVKTGLSLVSEVLEGIS